MPRTKKTSVKKTIEMEREVEMGQPQSEYPRRRTTPRTAARRSSAVGARGTAKVSKVSKATTKRGAGRKTAKRTSTAKRARKGARTR
jgi:hypothetical protein